MKSFLAYLGGKSRIAGKIVDLLPEHKCYCEVFAGAAWVFFKKDPSTVEVINDINLELITLYRVVKHHLDEFVRYFRWALISRDEFNRLKTENPETLTDIQRAARFYYLLRCAFSNRIPNPSFSVSSQKRSSFNILRIEEDLSAAHIRLANVTIENMHYADVIKRYDRETTVFYVDPPYYKCEDYYGKGIFSRDDFSALRELLSGIKGKFVMSINNDPEIRKIYKGFNFQTVTFAYTASPKKEKKKATELLITNFKR